MVVSDWMMEFFEAWGWFGSHSISLVQTEIIYQMVDHNILFSDSVYDHITAKTGHILSSAAAVTEQ